jgi:hypothetical protein
VLAVGDASFQHKCFSQFEKLKSEGRTILFVTHDMTSVERFCDRAMLIERGKMLTVGAPDEVSRRYSEINFGSVAHAESGPERSAPAQILETWCEDAEGERIVTQHQGARCHAWMEVEFREAVEDPLFAITFRNAARHTIFVARSEASGPTGRFEAGARVAVGFGFDNWLASSHYELTPSVAFPSLGPDVAVRREDLASLVIAAPQWSGGAADLPHEIEVRRL